MRGHADRKSEIKRLSERCFQSAAASKPRGTQPPRADGESFPTRRHGGQPSAPMYGSPRSSHGQRPEKPSNSAQRAARAHALQPPAHVRIPVCRAQKPSPASAARPRRDARRHVTQQTRFNGEPQSLCGPARGPRVGAERGDAARGLVGDQRRRSISFVACRTDR